MATKEIVAEIMAMETPVLTAKQASPLVGLSPGLLRWAAQHTPEKLGFPVVVARSRVLIPRIPLLQHYGYLPKL